MKKKTLMKVLYRRCIEKGGEVEQVAEHVADRWSGSVVCLLFFQAGLFPKNRAEPFFIHISMVVTRSSKAATPRCRNRFRMAHHARPSSASFSRHGCSPRSGLHLCTVTSYIYIILFFANILSKCSAAWSKRSLKDLRLIRRHVIKLIKGSFFLYNRCFLYYLLYNHFMCGIP